MDAHRYTPEQNMFLEENTTGNRYKDLLEMFNTRFGLQLNYKQISNAVHRRTLRTDRRGIFTKEQIAYLSKNFHGRSHQELTDMFNEEFNTQITRKQISHALSDRGLHNGLHGKNNKGLFKKGDPRLRKPIPRLRKPIGSEHMKDDCVMIKIANPDKWVKKHVMIWESAHGIVPQGHVVIFADKDRRNFALNNLILVSRRQLAVMNSKGLVTSDPDFTRAGIAVADLYLKISDTKKANKNISTNL